MPYCSQCGHFLAEDAKFCSECGRQVAAKPEPAQPSRPEPPQPLYTQPPQSVERGFGEELDEFARAHRVLFIGGCAAALLVVVLIVSSAIGSGKPNPHHLATPPVRGATTGAWPVTSTDVWCAWSNQMPPTNQQDLSSLEGSSDHVEMHITLHNTAASKMTVQVVSTYYIGNQSHGDSALNGHYRSVPAHAKVSWYLNAGTPQGVKADTPISECAPSIQLASG